MSLTLKGLKGITQWALEMNQMLEVKGLSKRFGHVQAVNDFDITIRPGEIVGLIGPNGAGKTTLIRSIGDILRNDGGKIHIGGFDMATHPVECKRLFAYIPEMPHPYEYLTVWEHVTFIARAYSMQGWEAYAEELLRDFDLIEKTHELVTTLSKGQKQKLTIVCGFIHMPQLIMLDEPLIGIDPKGARALKDRLVSGAREEGLAVLLSSHMLGLVEELADRVVIMHSGRKLAEGTLEELKDLARETEDARLEDAFLAITENAPPPKEWEA